MVKGDVPLGMLGAFCESKMLIIGINVVALVGQIGFVAALYLFVEKQRELEERTGARNPLDGVVTSALWGAAAFTVLITVLVLLQIIHYAKK